MSGGPDVDLSLPVQINHPLLVHNIRKVACGHEFSIFLTRNNSDND
jgi:alpha-tubulin suppressor-like RCC1 family protein